MQGYRGKILTVDLSLVKVSEIPLDESLAKKFIGGAGLGCKLLYDMIGPDTDPLGPDNPLIILTGPFCGTHVPTGSKTSVIARSPQTNLLGYSTFGGHLGADIKFSGYDGIIFKGQAEKPSYLYLDDAEVEIRSAEHLWGKDTQQTWDTLKDETGRRNAGIARIGVAGENLVKYASIIIDHYRAAGRTGMGAVMGSKKLKALVVHGSDRKVPVAEPEKLVEYASSLNESNKDEPTFSMYSEVGTAGFTDMATMMFGSFPAKYYTASDFDPYNISGSTVRDTILVGTTACYRCPIGCGRVIEINEGKYATRKFAGPELEVTGTMGSLILNNNLEALAYANKQLDLLGIDTISGGNIIALAYYLHDVGHISAQDIDGITPEWGEIESALALMEKIANREGIGNIMAEGSVVFGKKFDSESYAAQVNGLDLPMHDPRAFSGLTISYTTSPRGACHMSADMYNVQMGQTNEALGIESEDRFANEAIIAAKQQDFRCFTNSALMCNFYPILGEQLAELMNLVTGWEFSVNDVALIGERIFTLMRLLNLKLGYNPGNERLPEIIMQPLEGPTEGHVPNVEEQLETWYEYRKWDRITGIPSKEKLELLDLELDL
jgi:aldehyde:ferredoxin oxidoreductase